MIEVTLQTLAGSIEEGTIQTWFHEEGDVVTEGEDLVEIATSEGAVTLQVPRSGVLAEVYYDEGEVVRKEEVLCTIDDEENAKELDFEEEG
jgi:2-oxoglutarate dehydrogenase E2 component (dihydrolipoamide succinyltransferase)